MLTELDIKKIKHAGALQDVEIEDVRAIGGAIQFHTLAGEEKTKTVCKTLLNMGLQHIADDDKPEYYIAGAEGADRVDVTWPFDPARPVWNDVEPVA